MKCIPLSKGYFALVDDGDFEELSKYKWHYVNGYARRYYPTRRFIFMHQQIMGSSKKLIDHIDRNKLNNQRSNLRFVTRSQNMVNSGLSSRNKSGIKGVYWYKKYDKWRSTIVIQGKQLHLGYFQSIEMAENARVEAEKLYGMRV